MIRGIERLGENEVRIGAKTFRLGVCDRPLPDGTYLGVDAAGRPYSEYQQQIDLELLQGASAHQLFKGLYIGIYAPIVESQCITYMELANPYGNPVLLLSISFSYSDWTEDSNLNFFGKRLAEDFLKQITGCVSAKSTAEDVSVELSLKIDVPQDADLYQFIHAVDQEINGIVRHATAGRSNDSPAKTTQLKPDEHGYKWWLRYALIPLAGSAAILVIIQYLIGRT